VDPYGNDRGAAAPSWVDQRGYLGKPTDPSTGLSLLGARQYDSVTGRFLSVDPILEAGDHRQMNGYAYAGDDPVDTSDPSGLMIWCGGPCYLPPPRPAAPPPPPAPRPSWRPDYFVFELDFTFKIPVQVPAIIPFRPLYYAPINIQYPPYRPPLKQPRLNLGGIVNACGLFSLGAGTLCAPRPSNPFSGLSQVFSQNQARERPGVQTIPSFAPGPAQMLPGTTRMYIPVTVAISFIHARNGHFFLGVSAGVSSGETSSPGWSVTASLRAGYFSSRDPLSSTEIDHELAGPFVAAGGNIQFTAAAVVKNFSHGLAMEYGIAGTKEPLGGTVQVGYSWRIG
jgi:RHS repeat-associated protein